MMRDQKLWTWHLAAGVVILFLLGMHMTVMHLNVTVPLKGLNPAGGHPIDWANVVARGKSAFFMVTYVVLLGAALFHGLYGFRNIMVLLLCGLALFVYGTWAAIAGFSLAKAM
jgi:succinate dehydrogenase / fumarate reductase membrane anchor subunit